MDVKGTKTIETERLILRKFVLSDAKQMYEHWTSDTNVSRYVSWSTHKDVEETKNLLKKWIMEYDKGSFNWCVELKDTGELVGNISVIAKSEIHNNCKVGYCYGYNYW